MNYRCLTVHEIDINSTWNHHCWQRANSTRNHHCWQRVNSTSNHRYWQGIDSKWNHHCWHRVNSTLSRRYWQWIRRCIATSTMKTTIQNDRGLKVNEISKNDIDISKSSECNSVRNIEIFHFAFFIYRSNKYRRLYARKSLETLLFREGKVVECKWLSSNLIFESSYLPERKYYRFESKYSFARHTDI